MNKLSLAFVIYPLFWQLSVDEQQLFIYNVLRATEIIKQNVDQTILQAENSTPWCI